MARCLPILMLMAQFSVHHAIGQEVLPKNLQERLSSVPDDVTIGIAVIDETGDLVFQRNAKVELPTASAIKSAILLEFFAHFGQDISSAPEGMARILSDPNHPAIAHFSDDSRNEIAAALSGASIKRLGWIMIDKHDETGREYSNVVYNAATNIAIALLGGPAETTRAIHKRDKSFRGITVNRYMLANRTTTGDNLATPLALASHHRQLSSRQPTTVSAELMNEIHRILYSRDYPDGTKLYSKGGSLHSDPVTRVRAGWYQEGTKTMNFAIMCSQPLHATDNDSSINDPVDSGESQYEDLAELAQSISLDLKSAFHAR